MKIEQIRFAKNQMEILQSTNIDLKEVLDLDTSSNIILKDKYKNLFPENSYENWISNGKIVVDNSIYNVYNGIGDCSTIKILIEDNIHQNPII